MNQNILTRIVRHWILLLPLGIAAEVAWLLAELQNFTAWALGQ